MCREFEDFIGLSLSLIQAKWKLLTTLRALIEMIVKIVMLLFLNYFKEIR
jgi:hypothetical protein